MNKLLKRRLQGLSLIALSCFTAFSSAEGFTAKMVLDWLQLVDQQQYNESWDDTAPFFQSQVSRDQWQADLNKARRPLGQVLQRKISYSGEHKEAPGIPPGDYMVVMLNTRFEHKPAAIETVTMKKEKQGWQVVGYFIR